MQNKTMRLAIGLAAACLTAASMAQVKWVPNYQAAMKQAKASNKLVMVEFYTTWDTHGQDLESKTFSDATAQKVANKFVPVRIDIEKEGKDLGKRFRITNYPTVLFLDKTENVVGVIDGYENSDDFVKHGNTFIKDAADFPVAMAKYKKNPKDLEAVSRLGQIYAIRYQLDPAMQKLSEAEKIDPANKTDKLSDLYNDIADFYQNASKFEAAIKYFQKTVDSSKVTDKKAYGYLSIVACYFSLAQIDPSITYDHPITAEQARGYIEKARPLVDACLKLPNLKTEDHKIADQEQTFIKTVMRGG